MNRARKNDIIASITRAKIELDEALEDVKALPMVDPLTLGFVGHALHNYTHVALGTIQLLDGALKDQSASVSGWLKSLRDVTQRMGNLVDSLRIQQQTPPEMVFEKVDLVRLITHACHFYQRPARRKQIELSLETPEAGLPKVRTDRIAVAAILDNLLSNAVKYSPAGKQITVKILREAQSVVCRVEDQGPGIRAADRKLLFRRGVRLANKPTGGEVSTGYGLAVAGELIAHLGGEIGCVTEWGKGSCFYFRLPCPPGTSSTKTPGVARRRTT